MPARHHLSLDATPWETVRPGPGQPGVGQVHLWRARLEGAPHEVVAREPLLSAGELVRAARFHYARDRSAYVMARSTLRLLLGHYLGLHPGDLEFAYGPYGKPTLRHSFNSGLQFNLSHGGGYALLGFTGEGAIGVDLEPEDHAIEVTNLARRFFSPAESKQVLGLPTDQQVPAFFRTWARKEAFLKANGAGLSLPLEQFSVTVGLNEPVSLEHVGWDPQEADKWDLASCMVAEGLPAAVTLAGTIDDLRFYDFAKPD